MAQFITWLKNQQDRSDAIGRLAMAASRDPEFPKANKLNSIVEYLKSKGANDKLLDTVENAYAEFEFAPRRKSRKTEIPVTELKKGASKPATALAAKPAQKQASRAPVAVKAEKPAPAAPQPEKRTRTATSAKEPAAKPTKAKTTSAAAASKASKSTPQPTATNATPPTPASRKSSVGRAKTGQRETTGTTRSEESQAQTQPARGRQPKTDTPVAQLPDRLLPLQRQLADASAVLDAQFGKGYSAKNPAQVLDFARMLLTAEQNRMLHFTFADLAEALHRVASRLDTVMRHPY